MSPRMRQTTKGFEKYGESIEDMESARIVEATKRKEEMLSESDGAPLSPERVEVIERVKRGSLRLRRAKTQTYSKLLWMLSLALTFRPSKGL